MLSREPTHFVDVYPNMVMQHVIIIQADMLLACSSPKQSCTPMMEDDSTVSATDDAYVNYSHVLYKICVDYKRDITQLMMPYKQRRRKKRKGSRKKRLSERRKSLLYSSFVSLSCYML